MSDAIDNLAKRLAESDKTSDPKFLELLRLQGLGSIAVEVEQAVAETKRPLEYWLDRFITIDPEMIELKRRIKLVAGEHHPVLITGESGTGKELLAHALHSARKGQFVDVNCAGLPETLIESELFGHTKGAFTDAKTDKPGMFEVATDGTIFLDEIGELPLKLQATLLRAIQEKIIRRVGATENIVINARLVCATHHDLTALVRKNLFREDLYWRISTIEFKTKSMASRSGDLLPILKSLDEDSMIENEFGLEKFVSLINVKEHLKGNVRSLQQMQIRFKLFGQLPDGKYIT